MKKKSLIIIVSIAIFLACVVGIIFVKVKTDNRDVPHICFVLKFDGEKYLYMCADGNIYGSTSEKVFSASYESLEDKINQNKYNDILELIGKTDAKKVKKMYRLFCSVVLKDNYYLLDKYNAVPNDVGYEEKNRFWYGIYYEDDGILTLSKIYQSNSDKVCSDKRAYEIVEWMYECLKDYFDMDVFTTPAEQPTVEREKELLKDISESYIKEPMEDDIVFDEEEGVYYVRNQLLVEALLGTPKEAVEQLATELNADIMGYIELTASYQLEFREQKSYKELMEIATYLEGIPFVDFVDVNFVSQLVLD